MIELVGEGKSPKPRKVEAPNFRKQPSSKAGLGHDGFCVFATGILYHYLGLGHIPSLFARESDIKGHPGIVQARMYELQHKVLGDCDKYGYLVDIMDKAAYAAFKPWLLAQLFVDRGAGVVYKPLLCTAAVLDPFSLCHANRIPITLDVFTISSKHGRLVPSQQGLKYDAAPMCIEFECRPPEPEILELTKIVLQEKGS